MQTWLETLTMAVMILLIIVILKKFFPKIESSKWEPLIFRLKYGLAFFIILTIIFYIGLFHTG